MKNFKNLYMTLSALFFISPTVSAEEYDIVLSGENKVSTGKGALHYASGNKKTKISDGYYERNNPAINGIINVLQGNSKLNIERTTLNGKGGSVAIYIDSSGSEINISDSILRGIVGLQSDMENKLNINNTSVYGGYTGIVVRKGGSLSLQNSTVESDKISFSNNNTGVFNQDSNIIINNSTINGNGLIFSALNATSGVTEVNNSVISSGGSGGGVHLGFVDSNAGESTLNKNNFSMSGSVVKSDGIAMQVGIFAQNGGQTNYLLNNLLNIGSVIKSSEITGPTAIGVNRNGNINLSFYESVVNGKINVLLPEETLNNTINATFENSVLNSNVTGGIITASSASTADSQNSGPDVFKLGLKNKTTLNGSVNSKTSNPNDSYGGVNVQIDDSTWNMSDSSYVSALDNNGIINFISPSEKNRQEIKASQTAYNFKKLSVNNNMTGSGQFAMTVDMANNDGDQIIINKDSSGDYKLKVTNYGKNDTAPDNIWKIVDVKAPEKSSEKYILNDNGNLDAGAFRYVLRKKDDGSWYILYAGESSSENNNGHDIQKGEKVKVNPAFLSSASNAILTTQSSVAYSLIDMSDTLINRMGDLHSSDNKGIRFWIRSKNNKANFDNGFSLPYTVRGYGQQLGFDKGIDLKYGINYFGAFLSKRYDKTTFSDGNIKTDLYGVGIYNTYFTDSGWYADAVLHYGRTSSDVTVGSDSSIHDDDTLRNNVYLASLEAGKRNKFGDFYIEPQLQFTALYLPEADLSLKNMQLKSNSSQFYEMRAGLLIGHDYSFNNESLIKPWLRVSYSNPLKNKTDVNAGEYLFQNKIYSKRAEVNTGVTYKINNRNNIFLDAKYAKGDHLEMPYEINFGYQYLF